MKRITDPAWFKKYMRDAQWVCHHGISSTYPCPDCFAVISSRERPVLGEQFLTEYERLWNEREIDT